MKSKKTFILLLLSLLVISCSEKDTSKNVSNLYEFKSIISSTTSGVISVENPIKISLNNSIDSLLYQKRSPSELLKISPAIKGTIQLINDRTIVFIPNEFLSYDTEYSVKFKLNNLLPDIPEKFHEYDFKFKTKKQNFNIQSTELQSYNKSWHFLKGNIRTADVIELEKIRGVLSAKQNSKQLKIKWPDADSISTVFPFIIDSIQRFVDDSQLNLKWNGAEIDVENKGEYELPIAGKNNFSVLDIRVVHSAEQHVKINFSDPLNKSQNFDGLIEIKDGKNLKFVCDGNILKVYPENRLEGLSQIEIFNGIKNEDNFKLRAPYKKSISFEQLHPQIQLISNGVILPNSESLKFNFRAVNLSAVDLRVIKIYEDNILEFLQENELGNTNGYGIKNVGRRIAKKTIQLIDDELENNGSWKVYSVDLSDVIRRDPGAIYRIELTMKKEYSLYKCDGVVVGKSSENNSNEKNDFEWYFEESLNEQELDRKEEAYWDDELYSYQYKSYNWNDRNNPCTESYYNFYSRSVSAHILATNIGAIAKKQADNNYFFAAVDIKTANPLSNVNIDLYNFQKKKIKTIKTNSEGFGLAKTDNKVAFAIFHKDKDKTYMKLSDGNSLSLSKFDVAGRKLQHGLKGFLYGERGVWRPGDSIHLTFVLSDIENPLPQQHPVKLVVHDPRGKLVYKKIRLDHLNGFYKFTIPTSSEDLTGKWTAKVIVGGADFSKRLNVETVKPNRLKIHLNFKDKTLKSSKEIKGKLSINWLHGTPGKGLNAEVTGKLTSNSGAFNKTYPEFVFTDPTIEFKTEEFKLFEGAVDENGNGDINKKITLKKRAPGMLKASFLTKAFEKGGDFSMDVFSKNFASYPTFIGLKSPEVNMYNSYDTDTSTPFEILSINSDGNIDKNKDVEVEIYKIEWRWWWSSSRDNLSNYDGSVYHKPYKKLKAKTNEKGKAFFSLAIPNEDGGRYLVKVIDKNGGHSTGKIVYFYKDWWKRPSNNPEGSTMLMFSSDKDSYKVGETAIITFPSEQKSRALISIENGSKILKSYWAETSEKETKIEIPITDEMAPNIFVNISLIQPHASSLNDLPIRLFGVLPLLVEDQNTKLEPVISMPEVLRPDEKFKIKVKEKTGKRMTYTLAVVEEGLLDLTRFKTPQIWDAFYTKEALGVKTWDIYDEIIGAYGGKIENVFSIGGDGVGVQAENQKANRFKPVVSFLGPFVLNAREEAEHEVLMSKYVGAVRTMIVAGDVRKEAFGIAEKTSLVKKPLMVLASLPRKLSPGEKVTLPVTVFVMDKKIKEVKIDIKTSKGISVLNNNTKKIQFEKPEEKMAYFELEIMENQGVEEIEISVQGGGERSEYNVEVDVVNPNPKSSKIYSIELLPEESESLEFNTFGVKGTNEAIIEFSTLPRMDFSRRLQYLIRYPYGCVEQTTSAVFPQLYLSEIFDLTAAKKREINRNIEKGIKRIGRFQKVNGGLTYWIGQQEINDWGTSYAGHFMIEAKRKGFVLPLTFMENWKRHQRQAARNWRPRFNSYATDLEQAYRLYTLALAGEPELSAMNRLREIKNLSNDAKLRLAAAYVLSGQKEAAFILLQESNLVFSNSSNDYYTYGSADRNRAMGLETLLLLDNDQYLELSKTIAKRLSSNDWMSTQTIAYSLYALAKMVEKNGGREVDLEYNINNSDFIPVKSKFAMVQRTPEIFDGKNKLSLRNNKDNTVFVNVLNSGILKLGQEIEENRGLEINVDYQSTNGNSLDVRNLEQGTAFVAEVTVKNLKNLNVKDIALTQLFPSGWEIVNTRFTEFESNFGANIEYTEVKDDRVNFFFDLNKNESKTFKVLLNASYLGKYYLFGVQGEAMYDNDYFTRTQGHWIEVISK